MSAYDSLKTTNTAYFPRVTISGVQVITWDLQNVNPNVWNAMIDGFQTWIDNQNANNKSLSNLKSLYITNDATFSAAGTSPGVFVEIGAHSETASNPIANDFVAGYFYIGSSANRTAIWGLNPVVTVQAGADTTFANGMEIDMNNAAAEPTGLAASYPWVGGSKNGLQIVAGAALYKNSVGSAVLSARSGGGWHVGYFCQGAVDSAFWCSGGGPVGAAVNPAIVFNNDSNAGILMKTVGTHTKYFDFPAFQLDGTGNMALGGGITAANLPSSNPGAGSKKFYYDPADGNRVKFAA